MAAKAKAVAAKMPSMRKTPKTQAEEASYTVGSLAKLAGVTVRALHHYGIFMLFQAFGFRNRLFTSIIQFKYPILYFGKGRLILFVHKNLNYVNGENVKKESQIAIYIVRRVGLNITAR